MIDTTPFTNKESLHVALLLFNIAADKGAEEINIIQALSHNGYLFFPLIYKHFSCIVIQFKKPFDASSQSPWIVISCHVQKHTVGLTY